jgi:phospholipase/carboxylesterase
MVAMARRRRLFVLGLLPDAQRQAAIGDLGAFGEGGVAVTVALEGPALAPAAGGDAKQLIVLLHGYGADGADLIPLGEAWRRVLPDAAFVAPNAPEPCGEFPIGRQWFPLALRDRDEIVAGLAGAAPILRAFVQGELESRGLGPGDLALVGFSQGGMLALDVGLRLDGPIAGVVGLSCLLASPPSATDGPFPPVMLGHGTEDPLVPAAAMTAAESSLRELGISVEAHLRPGLSHGIDGDEIALAARFLLGCFGRSGVSNA